jgi:Dyp-type peroxidase family
MAGLPFDDIQGLVFSGYAKQRHATYLLLRIRERDAARRWLADLCERLSYGSDRGGNRRLNVAFSASGLLALGVQGEGYASFSPAFREGMCTRRRSRVLGDDGDGDPQLWKWGGPANPVDAVLLLYAVSEEDHRLQLEQEIRAATPGLEIAQRVEAYPLQPSLRAEHFGFADGISQPVLESSRQAEALSPAERRMQIVPDGEFVLGYKNIYGEVTSVPFLSDAPSREPFGQNGTYLVMRELRQHVASFWNYFREQAGSIPGAPAAELLAAKAVGRWPGGAPVVLWPDGPDPGPAQSAENAFGFRELDPWGERCPRGSHIRRSNPRDGLEGEADEVLENVNGHRLLRRGRSYGRPIEDRFRDDGEERGMLFACVNANIERQFEFVQQSWIGNPSFDRLQGEIDPVMGSQPVCGGLFSLPGRPVRLRLQNVPRFVTVRGGAYFFLPGRRGLRQLAQLRSS